MTSLVSTYGPSVRIVFPSRTRTVVAPAVPPIDSEYTYAPRLRALSVKAKCSAMTVSPLTTGSFSFQCSRNISSIDILLLSFQRGPHPALQTTSDGGRNRHSRSVVGDKYR